MSDLCWYPLYILNAQEATNATARVPEVHGLQGVVTDALPAPDTPRAQPDVQMQEAPPGSAYPKLDKENRVPGNDTWQALRLHDESVIANIPPHIVSYFGGES